MSRSTRTKPRDRPTTTGSRRPSSITQCKTAGKCSTLNVGLHLLAVPTSPCLTHNISKYQGAPKTLCTLRAITARRWAIIATSALSRKSWEKAWPIKHCCSANGLFPMRQSLTSSDYCQDQDKPLVWEYYGNAR